MVDPGPWLLWEQPWAGPRAWALSEAPRVGSVFSAEEERHELGIQLVGLVAFVAGFTERDGLDTPRRATASVEQAATLLTHSYVRAREPVKKPRKKVRWKSLIRVDKKVLPARGVDCWLMRRWVLAMGVVLLLRHTAPAVAGSVPVPRDSPIVIHGRVQQSGSVDLSKVTPAERPRQPTKVPSSCRDGAGVPPSVGS